MKEKIALDLFKSGLNCAQAVLTTFSEDLHLDSGIAKSVSIGFGGGMGRLQETCGAVTGSFMVLGIYNCQKYADNKIRKDHTYSMIQSFSDRFVSLHGTINCKRLLNCDLKTEKGQRFAKENNLFETICEKCITDSITILEDLMKE
ncbi:MAG: hypothetical protein H6Q25_578 [Bacteroidetes bacterium]|nr:hypothetical protein [Bacteroidota bacterium]